MKQRLPHIITGVPGSKSRKMHANTRNIFEGISHKLTFSFAFSERVLEFTLDRR